VTFFGEPGAGGRFQARLTAPPVLATVAELGGRVDEVVIAGGEIGLLVQLAPGVDVRRVIDVVRAHYPAADMVARRQVSRGGDTGLERAPRGLTGRQRAVLRAAYGGGFFEQPRLNAGADVAEALGISATTFHQHVRAATRELVAGALENPVTREGADRSDAGGRGRGSRADT